MKCEDERYERGTDLTIEDWINQMETDFTVGQVPTKAFVFHAHENSTETS